MSASPSVSGAVEQAPEKLRAALRGFVLRARARGEFVVLPGVFLSSAKSGLEATRTQVAASLEHQGFKVEAFEITPSVHWGITARITRGIGRADVLILLLGKRYGSPSTSRPDLSWTHLEWTLARERNLSTLHFLHGAHHKLLSTPPADPPLLTLVGAQGPACCEALQAGFIDAIRRAAPDVAFGILSECSCATCTAPAAPGQPAPVPGADCIADQSRSNTCDAVAARLWEYVGDLLDSDPGPPSGPASPPPTDGPPPPPRQGAVRIEDVEQVVGRNLRALMTSVLATGALFLTGCLTMARLVSRFATEERLVIVALGLLLPIVGGGLVFFWRTRPSLPEARS